ncbi:MAG TPA: hypothetical protein VGE62_00990 [Candidatus Paceibacterota bacterium]
MQTLDHLLIIRVFEPIVRLLQLILPTTPFHLARATLLTGVLSGGALFFRNMPASTEEALGFSGMQVAIAIATVIFASWAILCAMIEIDIAENEWNRKSSLRELTMGNAFPNGLIHDRQRIWYAGISLLGLYSLAWEETAFLGMFKCAAISLAGIYPAKCLAACKSFPDEKWALRLIGTFGILFWIWMAIALALHFRNA